MRTSKKYFTTKFRMMALKDHAFSLGMLSDSTYNKNFKCTFIHAFDQFLNLTDVKITSILKHQHQSFMMQSLTATEARQVFTSQYQKGVKFSSKLDSKWTLSCFLSLLCIASEFCLCKIPLLWGDSFLETQGFAYDAFIFSFDDVVFHPSYWVGYIRKRKGSSELVNFK